MGIFCHISFRDMFFFRIIKGIWDTGTPFQDLLSQFLVTYSVSLLADQSRRLIGELIVRLSEAVPM